MSRQEIFQILFICRTVGTPTKRQIAALERHVQVSCQRQEISGFFVKTGGDFVGLFEARSDQVLGQIEDMLRSHQFTGIEVLHEGAVARRRLQRVQAGAVDLSNVSVELIMRQQGFDTLLDVVLGPETRG
jgi:hypothetical protein